jgi:hypothetical protein
VRRPRLGLDRGSDVQRADLNSRPVPVFGLSLERLNAPNSVRLNDFGKASRNLESEKLLYQPIPARPDFDQVNPLQKLADFAAFVGSGFTPPDQYLREFAKAFRTFLENPRPGELEKLLGIRAAKSGRGHKVDDFRRESAIRTYAERYAMLHVAIAVAGRTFTKQSARWLVLCGVPRVMPPVQRPSEETFRKEFEGEALKSRYYSEQRECLEWEFMMLGRRDEASRARLLTPEFRALRDQTFALAEWFAHTEPSTIEALIVAHGARLKREDEIRWTASRPEGRKKGRVKHRKLKPR